jgi:O-antigen/teichoic acid export membrane protein
VYADEALGEPLRLALLPPIWAMLLATTVLVLQCSRRISALVLLENSSSLGVGLAGLGAVLLGGGLSGLFLAQAWASLLFAGLAGVIYRRVQAGDDLLPSWSALVRALVQPLPGLGREFRAGLAVALDKNLVSLYPLAPVLLLGALATADAVSGSGQAQVGLLRIAMSYIAVPLLALSAVSRLLMVKLPELQASQPRRVQRFYLQVTAAAGCGSALLTIPFVLLAPWLIGLLYGSDFAPAAALVPLLALDPLLAGFGIAAGPICRTYGRAIWAVWANLAVLAVGLPLAYLLIQQHGLPGAAVAYAGLVTALRAVSYLLCLRIVRAC